MGHGPRRLLIRGKTMITEPVIRYSQEVFSKEELIEEGHEFDSNPNNDDFEEFEAYVTLAKYEKDIEILKTEIKRLEMELGQKAYK